MITSNIDYPSMLPCFSAEYAYGDKNVVQRKVFLSGRSRSRLRNSSYPSFFSLKLLLKDDELEIFEGWQYWVIEDIKYFNADLKIGENMTSWVIRLLSSGFSKVYQDGYWIINFEASGFKND